MIDNYKKITLPRLISDGMVIQRNTQVKIWGWAPAGKAITVRFIDNVYHTSANEDGEWQVNLPTCEAGGPYNMVIECDDGTEKIIIKDVLLGDVWLCSGQSNMAVRMNMVKDLYSNEIAKANNNLIRQFVIQPRYDFESPQKDLDAGCWESVNSQNILNFAAVGYFFATELFNKYHIPIGLINASMGGAPAESFISEDGLYEFPDYLERVKKLQDKDYLDALLKEDQDNIKNWYCNINQCDVGIPEKGTPYFDINYDASNWPTIEVPSYWEDEGIGHFNGVVWFRKEINIPFAHSHFTSKIFLGNIVDEDTLYINGKKIGSTLSQYAARIYEIPKDVLKDGKNIIVVRVVNTAGKGGFYKGKPYHLQFNDKIIDLTGKWQYMIGVKSNPLREPFLAMKQPLSLYNGMIAPITRYMIKGAIWYQGETNAQYPENYESVFKALITDWRKKWPLGDFPFIFVQLPNYVERYGTAPGNWPIIREAQRKTLDMSNTGMAITIDIGEWNDVHPKNKKDVGIRLALMAQRVAYGDESVVASGPLFASAKIEDNRIICSFIDTGSGLIAKGEGELGHFEIAAADKVFVKANAEIAGNCVIVWHDKIKNPEYVRYAWRDNPEGANLYNREGLPASPFIS